MVELHLGVGIYLLTSLTIAEVAQQSKARRKDDFLIAFSPVIAEATATAYKGATNEVQGKLKRVVEVWRQRHIFEVPIQDAIEARIEGMKSDICFQANVNSIELDKSRSSTKKLGGSIFSSNPTSIPKELEPLVHSQQTISRLVLSTKTSINAANQDYDTLTDHSAVTPSPPVHAARLNGLLKKLANAEGAVAESIKARRVLIEGLEKILDTNRTALAHEESQLDNLSSRRADIDEKKKDVEDSIMRGFASNNNPGTPTGAGNGSPGVSQSPAQELDRPEIEALTPPGYSQLQTDEPVPEIDLNTLNGSDTVANQVQNSQTPLESPPSFAFNAMSNISMAYARPPSAASAGSAKKRKLSSNDDFPDLGGDAMDGLDADVAEMLRQDSGNGI